MSTNRNNYSGEIEMNAITAAVSAIDVHTFRNTLTYVLPHPDEVKWQEIPWQTDLWEARRLAVQQGKPIFLWAMNGNPLGCT